MLTASTLTAREFIESVDLIQHMLVGVDESRNTPKKITLPAMDSICEECADSPSSCLKLPGTERCLPCVARKRACRKTADEPSQDIEDAEATEDVDEQEGAREGREQAAGGSDAEDLAEVEGGGEYPNQ